MMQSIFLEKKILNSNILGKREISLPNFLHEKKAAEAACIQSYSSPCASPDIDAAERQ